MSKMSGTFYFVSVHHARGSMQVKVCLSGTKSQAARACRAKLERCPAHVDPDYRVVSEPELAVLRAQVEDIHSKNRKAGAESAKRRATQRVEQGKPAKRFILCPTCGAKSKKLRSEFGGLQTRRCQNGHLFEVDTFFGVESNKRRIEQIERPYFAPTGGNYNDWVYGRFKDDPTGKKGESK